MSNSAREAVSSQVIDMVRYLKKLKSLISLAFYLEEL